MPDAPPDSPAFREAYAAAESAAPARSKPGSIDAAVEGFKASKDTAPPPQDMKEET